MEQEGYWKWLRRSLKETFSKEKIKEFIIFPIWEIAIGCFILAFAAIWIAIPVYGIFLLVGQVILAILITTHGMYRLDKLW